LHLVFRSSVNQINTNSSMEKTCHGVWENCLRIIKDNVPAQSFKTWFEPIKAIKLENKILTIQVPSLFFYEWLEDHYVSLLRRTIKHYLGGEGRLEYNIIMEKAEEKKPYTINIPTSSNGELRNQAVPMPVNINTSIQNPFVIPGLKKVNIDPQLIPKYSFDSFIEGDCNRLARSAGFAVAGKPGGTSFNPLFLYGQTGLGKSHLIQAIGASVKTNFPDKMVLYVQAEKFVQQYIDSVKNSTINDFVNFYQLIDVLLIDDIQFFSGKEKTQEVFFSIFNHLHTSGKQIVMTSDKPPKDLVGVQERLLSRFKWGLSADLQSPDLETRIAILQTKMKADGIILPDEVIEYVAHNIDSNVRDLEG